MLVGLPKNGCIVYLFGDPLGDKGVRFGLGQEEEFLQVYFDSSGRLYQSTVSWHGDMGKIRALADLTGIKIWPYLVQAWDLQSKAVMNDR